MKKILNLTLSFVVALVLMPSLGFSQGIDYNDPKYEKYGADATAREANYRNYAFFREAFKMNSTADAIKRLEELMVACPEANENIYIIGLRLYRTVLDEAQTVEAKKEALDKIMRIYDYRAKYFNIKNGVDEKYKILGDKMREMMSNSFMWDNYQDEVIKNANALIKESGANIDMDFAVVYLKSLTDRYMGDMLHSDVVLEEFSKLSDAVAKNTTSGNKAEILRTMDALLINSNAADCDNLEKLFKPQYEKNPNDIALIKKIMRYLSTNDCDSPFKTMLAEKYYKLEPSADAAYNLATSFYVAKDYPKATQYFKEAISRETDREVRAKYEFRLASLYLVANKNNALAAEYAKKAIASDPRNGLAYFILSQAYLMGSHEVSCDAFEKKAVNWLVYSNMEKAISLLDPSASQVADMKKIMSALKGNFPNMEDLFFKESLKVGDSYTVNCGWIKGVTKVYDPK